MNFFKRNNIYRNFIKILFIIFKSQFINKILELPQRKRKILLSLSDLITNYISILIIYFSTIFNQLVPTLNIYLFGLLTSFIIVLVYNFTNLYHIVARFSGTYIIYNIFLRNISIVLILYPVYIFNNIYYINNFFLINFLIISTTLTVSSRLIFRDLIKLINNNSANKSSALLYGFSNNIDNFLKLSAEINNFQIVAFVDHDDTNRSRNINGLPIIRLVDVPSFFNEIEYVIIDSENLELVQIRNLYKFFKKYNIKLLETTKPKLISLSPRNSLPKLNSIKIEDILGRKPVPPLLNLMEEGIKSQVVCITGAGGSIGSELSFEIMFLNPSKLILIDNNEHNLYKCHQRLICQFKELENKIFPFLCDVSREKCLLDILEKYKINKIFHAAAYKHVSLLETNYIEGLRNNIFSTYNLCKYAYQFNIDSFILISSDKAVRPKSIMGASKRVSELIVQAFAKKISIQNKKNLLFSMVRFGNVLGSSGSVVPLFESQINNGGPVTVTDPNVIRYFMTVKEASQLVIQSSVLAEGGDLFLLDMGKPIKIIDLAKQMINLSGLTLKNNENPNGDIEIEFSGLKKGEKLYEELLIGAQSKRTNHPLIYKAIESSYSGEISFWDKLNELKLSLDKYEKDESLKILNKLVPEFIFQSIK